MSESESGQGQRAFEFDGNWREFAPIAITNLLLTIVTLGVYTFWARARERRYLWSHTRFIDDRLEWVGTGLELLIGYVLAILVFVLPVAGLDYASSALKAQGQYERAFALWAGVSLLVFYLVGVAIFRALRYRLSRTYWHGIRGGSDDNGLNYGLSHVWRTGVGWLALLLMLPWAMTSLWNMRWNKMSFGPHMFEAKARWNPLLSRYLIFYLLPIVMLVGIGITFALIGPGAGAARAEIAANIYAAGLAFYVIFFVLFGLIALFYYSAYFREAIGALKLGELEFDFDARTWDWFKLSVVNLALVVFTLGIGAIFLGYRNWAFFIRHLNAYGAVNLDYLTQSETGDPGQGEGLLDAFDVGAF